MGQYQIPDEKRATVSLGLRFTPEDMAYLDDISQAVKLPHQVKVLRFALRQTHALLVAQGLLKPREGTEPTRAPVRKARVQHRLTAAIEQLRASSAKVEQLLALQGTQEKA